MGLGAGTLEVGVLAAFAVRPVARTITEAVGEFLLWIHHEVLRDQLTLSLLALLEACCGAGRPA
ncbi:MAG: hypothetical protein NVSMB34_09740 [Variovorax sp.]